jgi:protein-S-isoprenylcysteine O-methyltransferase Ste14
MRITDFEFRHRSLLNLLHFWVTFQVYVIDHTNIVWAVIPWNTPHGRNLARFVFAFGALMMSLAAGVRTWAAAYLRSEVVHDPNLHSESLVADGPYRYVRNPLYLGTFLFSLGLGLLASRLGFLILVIGAAVRLLRLIRREETELEKQQGECFREYCRRVPKWWPSLRPRVPASRLEPRWPQAFRGEAAMWGFFVTMIAFAVTLRNNVVWTLSGLTLIVWLTQRVAQRLQKIPRG